MPLGRQRRGAVEILVIDREKVANAIDFETSHALANVFDELEHDDEVRAVVLTGAGDRVFCAGMDLGAVRRGEADSINLVPGGFAGIVRRDFPFPLIAAVNGAAVGGGFEIVLACDLVVAADHATFGLPEVKRGLFAASGGLVRLARRIAPPAAFELAFTGETIDAERAERLGLVNRVVERGRALETAIEIGQRIAQNAPLALRASKQLLRRSLETSEGELWELNAKLAAEVLSSEDAAEGAAAFNEKRVPKWSGR
ncbi:MAG: crotonase/enoyl-CoA hydratase family protein [Acidimicrobiales bacterium]